MMIIIVYISVIGPLTVEMVYTGLLLHYMHSTICTPMYIHSIAYVLRCIYAHPYMYSPLNNYALIVLPIVYLPLSHTSTYFTSVTDVI